MCVGGHVAIVLEKVRSDVVEMKGSGILMI